MYSSGISWAICKSAPRSRQITTPAPHYWVFYRPDALPAAQPTASKHWRQHMVLWLSVRLCEDRIAFVCDATGGVASTESRVQDASQGGPSSDATSGSCTPDTGTPSTTHATTYATACPSSSHSATTSEPASKDATSAIWWAMFLCHHLFMSSSSSLLS